MLIGLETKETEDQLQDIYPWLEVILSHGKVKKQKVVSLSSAEAELRGIAKGLAEALWIRKLVSEIGFPPKESIRIMSDNKAAIQISCNMTELNIYPDKSSGNGHTPQMSKQVEFW
ncbi:hypothetical protein Tco_0365114 [Tanacetum coccineum]